MSDVESLSNYHPFYSLKNFPPSKDMEIFKDGKRWKFLTTCHQTHFPPSKAGENYTYSGKPFFILGFYHAPFYEDWTSVM